MKEYLHFPWRLSKMVAEYNVPVIVYAESATATPEKATCIRAKEATWEIMILGFIITVKYIKEIRKARLVHSFHQLRVILPHAFRVRIRKLTLALALQGKTQSWMLDTGQGPMAPAPRPVTTYAASKPSSQVNPISFPLPPADGEIWLQLLRARWESQFRNSPSSWISGLLWWNYYWTKPR